MSRVEDVAARSLIPFVQTTVAPGATVRTDGYLDAAERHMDECACFAPARLDYDLDEFTFRFNRRRSQARGRFSSDCSSRRCSTSRSPTRA